MKIYHTALGLLCAVYLIGPLAALGAELQFEPLINYEMPPERGDSFVQSPNDGTFDDQGNLYLLDSGAKCVFVWDREGKFVRTLGRGGTGPGEFSFARAGRTHIAYNGSEIIVLDDSVRKLHYFRDLAFVETREKSDGIGRLTYFKCLANGKVVVWERKRKDRIPFARVYLADQENLANPIMLLDIEDKMYRRNKERGWDFFPACPKPVISADYHADMVIIGDSISPRVKIYNTAGKLMRELTVTLNPPEYDQASRRLELTRKKWLKPPHRAMWPKYNRRYSGLEMLPGHQVLVRRYIPERAITEGVLYSEQGKALARLNGWFGEGGGMMIVGQRLVLFYMDEDGELSIKSARAVY